MSTQGMIDTPVERETRQADVATLKAPLSVTQHSPVSAHKSYAGLWRRFLAYIIDALIIGVSVASIATITGIMNETIKAQIEVVLRRLMYSVGAWLYFSLFESSQSQATPGKLVLGIKVVGPYGTRISFGRATGRFFATALSNLTFGIGYIMAGFTPKKQALHDMITNCFVVRR